MNIDTSKIENFAEMDADALRKFIEDFQFDDHSEEYGKVKKRNDELSKENADYKRKLNASKDEGEKSKNEYVERIKELEDNYNSVIKDREIDRNTIKFQRLGYSEELAQETALAYANGDIDKVVKNQKTFQDAFEKKIREDVIKNTPKPDVKGKPKSGDITKEEFEKMGYTERMELYSENKELYDKLTEE